MKIKVCGITSVEQMQQLQELGIDYAGMIFYEHSKRFAGDKLHKLKSAIKNLEIKKVGVFVNENFETVSKAIVDFGLTAVQLHGDETDEFCLELMDKAKVIKVFRIADETNIEERIKPFQHVCDYFLFDTHTTTYGGSGKQFDWEVLGKAKINKPFFLSGGIGLEDTEKLHSFQHLYLYAIDVNSRFEKEPGVKDIDKIQQFINIMKHEKSKPFRKI